MPYSRTQSLHIYTPRGPGGSRQMPPYWASVLCVEDVRVVVRAVVGCDGGLGAGPGEVLCPGRLGGPHQGACGPADGRPAPGILRV